MTQLAFVAYPGFTALDMIGPYEVLRNLPDAEVRFVWHETGPITADSGVLVIGATHSLAETPSPDVILVPGGPATPVHARDQALLDWLRRAHQTASWTTSVCSGSVILAAAGLLEGRRATSHWLTIPALKAFGAIRSPTSGSCARATSLRVRVCRRGLTWRCGWPARSAAKAGPERSSSRSNTTRSLPSTLVTCRRRRGLRKPPPPRCYQETVSTRPI